MKVNTKMMKEMVNDFKFGLMVRNMTVRGIMIKYMILEYEHLSIAKKIVQK